MSSLFWLLVLLGMGAALGLGLWLEFRESTRRKVERVFECPVRHEPVAATFVSDQFDFKRYDSVEQCSAFPPGAPLDCDRECLQLPKEEIESQDHAVRPVTATT